ncbi:proteoglycan 4-like [Mycetomoellerius zeteki]|uniref:proteoglycan 4-like n=1 Tax=Mycetomoellerius zeteki TaxID=64791 RepID=UPI00084E8E09|nr:PREDICTED: proteoglycan 4-like [Trachymyrmex zeteki]
MRWKLKLAEYDYTINYKPGKKNKNAKDALSRNPVTEPVTEIINIYPLEAKRPLSTSTESDPADHKKQKVNHPNMKRPLISDNNASSGNPAPRKKLRPHELTPYIDSDEDLIRHEEPLSSDKDTISTYGSDIDTDDPETTYKGEKRKHTSSSNFEERRRRRRRKKIKPLEDSSDENIELVPELLETPFPRKPPPLSHKKSLKPSCKRTKRESSTNPSPGSNTQPFIPPQDDSSSLELFSAVPSSRKREREKPNIDSNPETKRKPVPPSSDDSSSSELYSVLPPAQKAHTDSTPVNKEQCTDAKYTDRTIDGDTFLPEPMEVTLPTEKLETTKLVPQTITKIPAPPCQSDNDNKTITRLHSTPHSSHPKPTTKASIEYEAIPSTSKGITHFPEPMDYEIERDRHTSPPMPLTYRDFERESTNDTSSSELLISPPRVNAKSRPLKIPKTKDLIQLKKKIPKG